MHKMKQVKIIVQQGPSCLKTLNSVVVFKSSRLKSFGCIAWIREADLLRFVGGFHSGGFRLKSRCLS